MQTESDVAEFRKVWRQGQVQVHVQNQKCRGHHVKQRAEEIFQEKTYNLGIDEFDINTEIIKLMAGEILQKTEFFDMIKKSNSKQQN